MWACGILFFCAFFFFFGSIKPFQTHQQLGASFVFLRQSTKRLNFPICFVCLLGMLVYLLFNYLIQANCFHIVLSLFECWISLETWVNVLSYGTVHHNGNFKMEKERVRLVHVFKN